MGWLVFLHIVFWGMITVLLLAYAVNEGTKEWFAFSVVLVYFTSFLVASPSYSEMQTEAVVMYLWMSPSAIVAIFLVIILGMISMEVNQENTEKENLLRELAFWNDTTYAEASLKYKKHNLLSLRKELHNLKKGLLP